VTNRRLFIFFVGATLVGVGLVALNFPVFLDTYDQWGSQINCGRGYQTDLIQAQIADRASSQSTFVDECQSALAARRAWTIPVAVAGWVVLSCLAVALWRRASPHAEIAHDQPR
jgi:hypothetical protein